MNGVHADVPDYPDYPDSGSSIDPGEPERGALGRVFNACLPSLKVHSHEDIIEHFICCLDTPARMCFQILL